MAKATSKINIIHMIGPWMTLMAMKMKIEKELQMLFTTLEFTVFVHQNVTANVMRL